MSNNTTRAEMSEKELREQREFRRNELESECNAQKDEANVQMINTINQFITVLVGMIGDSPQQCEIVQKHRGDCPNEECWILYDNQRLDVDEPYFWLLFTAKGRIVSSTSKVMLMGWEIEAFLELSNFPHPLSCSYDSYLFNHYGLVKIFDGLVKVAEIHKMPEMVLSTFKLHFDSNYAQYCRAIELWEEMTYHPF